MDDMADQSIFVLVDRSGDLPAGRQILASPDRQALRKILAGYTGASLHEPEIRCGKAADVWEDCWHLRGADSEPRGQRRRILDASGRGHPASVRPRIIRAVERQGWEGPIHLSTFDRAAHHDVV